MTNVYMWIWIDDDDRVREILMAGRDTVEEAREELLDWLLNDDTFYDEIVKSDEAPTDLKDRLRIRRELIHKLLLEEPTFKGDGSEFQRRYHF